MTNSVAGSYVTHSQEKKSVELNELIPIKF